MKRQIFIWALCLFSEGVFCNEQMRLSLTRDLCTPRSVYLSLPRVNPDEIDSLKNVININHGDTIVELFCPPIMNQGDQESCAGWALGYGCASIQAYDTYQDWNWAKRSPSFLYNQAHNGTTCGVADIDSILRMLSHQGVCAYYLMPYDETDCNTQPNSIQRADAALNKSVRLRLSNSTDIAEYKQVLRMGHSIGVLTEYATDLQTLCATPSAHGVWTSIVNPDTTQSHTMCIIGYDDHQHMFKVMNSWGTNSGDNGFVWVSYNLVQSGAFKEAYILDYRSNGFVPQIEGPDTLHLHGVPDSAWYYIRNVPSGATITWNVTNTFPRVRFVLVSPQGRDSMYVAYRGTPLVSPPVIENINNDIEVFRPPFYHRETLSASINYGTASYTATKQINMRVEQNSATNAPQYSMNSSTMGENIEVEISTSGDAFSVSCYSLELWSPIYGLMRTKVVQSTTEQMDISGLPQGVYILLLKANGTPIAETKVLIQ